MSFPKRSLLDLARWILAVLALVVSLIPGLHPCCCGPVGLFCSANGPAATVPIKQAHCCVAASHSRSSGPVIRGEARHCCTREALGSRDAKSTVSPTPRNPIASSVIALLPSPAPIALAPAVVETRRSSDYTGPPDGSSLPILLCDLRI